MATNYPGSLDTSTQQPSPSASTEMDDSGFEHDVVHANHSGAIIAVETKVGTGASTPVANSVLGGTGSGTSAWTTTPTLGGLTVSGDAAFDTDTLFVDVSEDRVGVGTNSPSNTLHVNGGTANFVARFESTDSEVYIGLKDSATSSGGHVAIAAIGDDLVFRAGNNNAARLKSDGKLGIGTSSPSVPLHVATGGADHGILVQSTDSVARVNMQDNSTTDAYAVGVGATGDALSLFAGSAERVTVASDGKVGIATTSPAHPLDVVGEARFSTSVQFNNGGQVIRNWGSGAIDNLLPGSTFGGILEGNSSGHFVIGIRDNDTNDSFSVISGGGDQTTNGYDTVVAYFGADGDVGIGTASPLYRLHVNSGTTNTVAEFESTDTTAYIAVSDNNTSAGTQVALGAVGDELRLRAGNTNHVTIETGGTVKLNTNNIYTAASSKTLIAASPPTGTGNDAEWAAPLGIYILYRNSSLAAEKENISADLGTHLTADMIDQVVPKMWNRIHAPGYPEIGPIAEDMDAISPFLAARGTTAENVPFLTGINKTAYLSLLVLAVKDLRQRVVELENA